MTMGIEGDVKALRVKVEGLEDKVDRLDSTMRTGFADIKDGLREIQKDRTSDVKGLSKRLDSQDSRIVSLVSKQSEGGGAARILMYLIPILIGAIIATIGFFI